MSELKIQIGLVRLWHLCDASGLGLRFPDVASPGKVVKAEIAGLTAPGDSHPGGQWGGQECAWLESTLRNYSEGCPVFATDALDHVGDGVESEKSKRQSRGVCGTRP